MRSLVVLLLLCVAPNLFAASRALDQGEINGAKFAIVLPAQWNRRVLLVAPGLRRENEPLAVAFSPADVAYKTLFNEGWMVAKTSFRRNGIIVTDALADLDALRNYIATKYGQPQRVIVEGETLGGLIAVLIAERNPREPKQYDGVVAISAAFHLKETPAKVGLMLQPKIPILFLSNQGELEAPKSYIASPFARETDLVSPVLFRISRGGHANINQAERLLALRAIDAWLDRGVSALPKPAVGEPFYDATAAPNPRPSTVAMHENGQGFETRVTGFLSAQDHVLLDAQPADFATADIMRNTWFRLTAHGKTYRVFYGRDFNNVKKNKWVAIPHAEGGMLLARNFGVTAATANIAVGDTVTIERFE